MNIRLSVLDITPLPPETSASEALGASTRLVQLAEKLGYLRYWVTEHHGVHDIGGCSPATLIAHLAAKTSRIRLGSGGVMLPNHPPLLVAEQFAMLEALYPGRIDLGLGRAGGGDPRVAVALRREAARLTDEDFNTQLDDLHGFLTNSLPEGHPCHGIRISLSVPPPPQYLLGSAPASAVLAGKRGMAYGYAHHLNPADTKESIATYKATFRADANCRPYALMTICAVSAQTEAEAVHAATRALVLKRRMGLAVAEKRILSRAEQDAAPSSEEQGLAGKMFAAGRVIAGTGASVSRRLMELAEENAADEVAVVPIEFDVQGRARTLRSISENWPLLHVGLERAEAVADLRKGAGRH